MKGLSARFGLLVGALVAIPVVAVNLVNLYYVLESGVLGLAGNILWLISAAMTVGICWWLGRRRLAVPDGISPS